MRRIRRDNIKQSKQYGITLIALVISIIIMLILAGVVMQLSIGDNGLINRTQYVTDLYEEEYIKEQIK